MRRRYASAERPIVLRGVAVAVIVVLSVIASDREDWDSIGLLLTLGLGTIVADLASVAARSVRLSVGLMVQTTAMALLGPAPAVLIAIVSTLIDARVNRVSLASTMNNLLTFSLLGLVGGVLFEVLGDWLDLGVEDTAYALLALPVYLLLAAINLAMVTVMHPELPRGARVRVFWESGVPVFPLEFINGGLVVTIILAWANAGLVVAAPLVMILAVIIPLSRTVGSALTRTADLMALRQVSDERAAEVERLASDRERLLTEVVDAESRERARLAESLHDGPMQRLMAVRQDAADERRDTSQLDEAIAETRAIISAFHPAAVRELGFEASLRAAVAPFPAARSIALAIHVGADDSALADTLAAARRAGARRQRGQACGTFADRRVRRCGGRPARAGDQRRRDRDRHRAGGPSRPGRPRGAGRGATARAGRRWCVLDRHPPGRGYTLSRGAADPRSCVIL